MSYPKSSARAHALIMVAGSPVASPDPEIVGDPRRIVEEALEVCSASTVARRLGVSDRLVRGWRSGDSLPNVGHLARAPEAFTRRIVLLLSGHLDARTLTHHDPDQALTLALQSLGLLLGDIARVPIEKKTKEELRHTRDMAAQLEESARQLREAASAQLLVVEGQVSK